MLLVFVASAVAWLRLLWTHRFKLRQLPQTLVPRRSRQRPFWNPGDALVMFGTMQLIGALLAVAISQSGGMSDSESAPATGEVQPIVLVQILLVSGLAASAITLGWLWLCDREAIGKLGLSPSLADLTLGLKAALLLLPPVLLISAAAGHFVQYEHPVLDLLGGLDSAAKIVTVFLATAVVTPFVEEFLFRVLLIGGLERIADPMPNSDDAWRPRAWWPVVVSSLIFATMHLGQGAAPIPLFFLAMGLGFLYRQTGGITAPVVVHVVLNSVTLIVELVRIEVGA